MNKTVTLRARQRFGKYRIERKIDDGGFASVYQAYDTIEGIRIALKVPHEHLINMDALDEWRNEIRIASKLNHPHILPLKTADVIDGRLVMAYPLGEQTLSDRLKKRMSFIKAIELAEQMIDAVAHAHANRVIHCDIKPENMILFKDGHLMLADLGIAKVATKTVHASGSGTIGYCAPEQAMGHPSFRSDVFSLGLILFQLFTRHLPEWPFSWPPEGIDKLRTKVHPDFVDLIRKSIEVEPRKRFASAEVMLSAFIKIKPSALQFASGEKTQSKKKRRKKNWRQVKFEQFQRQYGKSLATTHTCSACQGPVAEAMHACPWCGDKRAIHDGETSFPRQCSRCNRGMKSDWTYCAWCYGPGFELDTKRKFDDKRYSATCGNKRCSRKSVMPFMRYCPWCHCKIKKNWKVETSDTVCHACHWGIVPEFWSHCPWCSKVINK